MPNHFQDKSMRCLAISASSSQRQLLSSVLKDVGYLNVVVVADIKSCLELIEAEEVGWIISPVVDANEVSALQLFEVLNKHRVLRRVKVSLIRDEHDNLLPQCFALGALSCHKFAMTREAVFPEFKRLTEIIQAQDGDFPKVAAIYLTDYLKEAREFGDLHGLYQNMLQLYPGDGHFMIELGEALLAMGEKEKAKVILQQAQMTLKDKNERLETLLHEQFQEEEEQDEGEIIIAEHFGFHSCLVIDPTPESLETLIIALKKLGFTEIHNFRDPVSAMKWLRQNKKVDLILSEWTLPDVPGPIFLYKLRHRLGLSVPLLIINERIAEREAPLISELGASKLLSKPIELKALYRDIIWTLQQHTNPTDPLVIKQKLLIASKQHDLVALKKLKQLYFAVPSLLEQDKLLIEAQIALDSGCFHHAKKHALAALKSGGDSREAMEILGKSLMKLREFDAAIRCLKNVSFISPLNVSHLCQLAVCHLEQGNDQAFDQALKKAETLDQDADEVVETAAKGAIKRGHTESAKKLLSRLKSFKEILAFMNNRAVSLIRVGNFQEGFELYRRTLESLPDNQNELRSLINYNLGLGYARANRLEDALQLLADVEKSQNAQRVRKAKSLKTRIIASVNSGEPIVLKSDPPPTEKDEEARLKQIQQIESTLRDAEKISRADFCLINVYRTTIAAELCEEFLEKKMSFTPRGRMIKDYHKGLVMEKKETEDEET